MLFRLVFLLPIFISFIGWTGCASSNFDVVNETDEKQYQLGQDYKNQGRLVDALEAFLRVIDARRDAPESHLEAGYIYLKRFKDPILAIYHFDRYIKLKPQSSQAKQVRQLIETAQKEFVRQLPAEPYEGNLDRIDLMDLVKTLKLENDNLKRELMGAIARVEQLEGVLGKVRRSTPGPQVDATSNELELSEVLTSPSSAPRSYIVQSGDTLSDISKRFYGTPSRWIDIYQSNRDRMSSESALRVGQVIRIP